MYLRIGTGLLGVWQNVQNFTIHVFLVSFYSNSFRFFFFLIKSEQESMVSVREGEKFSVAC